MFCENCGTEINDNEQFCTSCGTPKPKTNALCVTGFIVGIVSIFLNLFGITGIAAIIFSAIGLNQIKSTNEGGNAFAWVGIGTGIFSVVLGIIAIIALLIMIAAS